MPMLTKHKILITFIVITMAVFGLSPTLAKEGYFKPAIGDVRADLAGPERIITTPEGGINVYTNTGKLASNYPLYINGVVVSSPVLADIDTTGEKEIIFVGRDSSNSYTLYAYRGDKTLLTSISLGTATIYYDPVSILNSSGKDDIILTTTQGQVLLFHYNGTTFLQSTLISVNKAIGVAVHPTGQELIINYSSQATYGIYIKKGAVWTLQKNVAVANPIIYPIIYDLTNKDIIYVIDKNGKLHSLNKNTGGKISTKFPLTFSASPIDSPYWAEVDSSHTGQELLVNLSDGSVVKLDKFGAILGNVSKDKSFEKSNSISDILANQLYTPFKESGSASFSSQKREIISVLSRRQFKSTLSLSPSSTQVASVSDVNLTAGQNSVAISWQLYQGDSNFSRFNIYRSNSLVSLFNTNTLLAQLTSVSSTVYNDSLAQSGETYYYAVKAVNKSGLMSANNWLGPVEIASVSSSTSRLIYLPFDEQASSTTFADLSGNNINGYCNGQACSQSGVTGKIGKAISFDGINNYVSVSNTSTLSPQKAITVEAWVYPTASSAIGSVQMIATKNYKYELGITTDGRLRVGVTNSSGYRKANNSPLGSVKNNQWNYVALTYDGMAIKGYVDGKLVLNFPHSGDIQATTQPLTIGQGLPAHYRFKGLVDELEIFGRALPALEIYNKYIEGIGSHLIYLPLDEPALSTKFIDKIGHGNNGNCNGITCPSVGLTGRIGNTVSFDGLDDFLTVNHNAYSLNPQKAVTVEAWVYPTMSTGENNLQMIATKNFKIEFGITTDGRLRAGITNASSTRKAVNSAPNKVINNQWNHLIMTYDGSKIKGFVNGILVASLNHTGDIQSTSYPLTLGKALPDAYILHGRIDEFNMYNIALSDADVLTKYKLYSP